MKRANSLTWFSLFFLFSIGFTEMCAQDRIIKTNQDTIHCQIKEILDDEVKYIDPKLRNDLVFGIDKNKVDKIVLANGAEVEISDSMYGKAEYEDQSQNVIKARLFGPLYGALDFSFEHSIKPGSSYEGTIGFIGTGLDNYGRNPQGAYVKLGYKLIKSPDFYLKGMRYAHILKGSYVRPEIIFAAYEVNKDEYLFDIFYEERNVSRTSVVMGAVVLNIGKQWVFNDVFVIDWFVGAGYGFGKNKSNYYSHIAFWGGASEFPLALTSGFRIGVAF